MQSGQSRQYKKSQGNLSQSEQSKPINAICTKQGYLNQSGQSKLIRAIYTNQGNLNQSGKYKPI